MALRESNRRESTTKMGSSAAEPVAPGEEQVVFSRTAGVVASKVSYMDVLDPANDWQVLENPHENDAAPLTCQFNRRGTHFAVGDEAGRVDLWSFVPMRMYVKSLELTHDLLDTILPPATPSVDSAAAAAAAEKSGGRAAAKEREDVDHGWSTTSVGWSRCSRYMVAAYVQKRKTWPNGEEVLLPGLAVLWDMVEEEVKGFLRLPSRIVHASLSPSNPRCGSVCCADGNSFLAEFPSAATTATATVTALATTTNCGNLHDTAAPVQTLGTGSSLGEGEGGEQQQQEEEQKPQQLDKDGCLSDARVKSPWAERMTISGGTGDVSLANSRAAVAVAASGDRNENGDGAMGVDDGKEAGGDNEASTNVSSNNSSTGSSGADTKSSSGCAAPVEDVPSTETSTGAGVGAGAPAVGHMPVVHNRSNIVGSVGVAKLRKIWDPAVRRVDELFSATTTATAAGASTACEPSATSGSRSIVAGKSADRYKSSSSKSGLGSDLTSGLGSRGGEGKVDTDAVREEAYVSSSSSSPPPSPSCAGGVTVSSVSGGTSSGSSVNRAVNRGPMQAGRVAWCDDGETFFLLNHEGNLLKIKTHSDGSLSVLARADPQGGASPATLQLAPDGDKVLIATATRGLCLVPTEDLDLLRAESFGENLGPRGAKARYWGAATLGDIHGRGHDGSRMRRLTIVGNPSRTRDDKTDLFFFCLGGGQPERIDTPRREGVLALACSPRRPLLMFLCPTGEVYFKEEVLKTDFPGPWYPSGYVLIDNNVDYLEAEDELDTVVMTGPGGEVLSKTQAHEVVVPWQHEAVAQEDSSLGEKEEPVDVEGDMDTELWTDPRPGELRWIPEREDSWPSEGGSEDGSGGPRSSPRGGGQESFGGPLARLLGATPALLKEARKRFGSSDMSENDLAEKRRKMVPKMMEDLAIKKKKNDEEAIKRKRKLEEARAKARRNRERKAAAEAKKAAEMAKEAEIRAAAARAAAEDEAARKMERDLDRTDTAKAAPNDRHPMVGVQALLTTSGNMKGRGAGSGTAIGGTRSRYDGGVRSGDGSTAGAGPLVTETGAGAAAHTLIAPPDDWPPSTNGSNGCGGGAVGGAAADAAAWLAANAPDDGSGRQVASSTLAPATSSWGSRGLLQEGARAAASTAVVAGEITPVSPAVLGNASGGGSVGAGWRQYAEEHDGSARSHDVGAERDYQQPQDSSSLARSGSRYHQVEDRGEQGRGCDVSTGRRYLTTASQVTTDRGGSRTLPARSAMTMVSSESGPTPMWRGDRRVQPPSRPEQQQQQHTFHGFSMLAEAVAHGRLGSPTGDRSTNTFAGQQDNTESH